MAKLPSPEDYGTSLPQATRGITNIQPDISMGRAIAGIGELFKQEADKLEDVAAEDALNKLREKRIEMSVGEGGFSTLKGGQIITQKPLDIYPKKFDQEADAIGATLHGSRAKARYAQARSAERARFGENLFNHVARETDTYAGDTAKASVSVEAKTLSLGYSDQATVASSFGRLNQVVATEAARLGLTGPALEAYQSEVMGAGHSAILSAAMAKEDSTYAKNYLDANKDKMTKQQIDHFAPLVQKASDFEGGKALGLEASAMLESGKPANEVEAYLVKKSTSPGMMSVAQGTLGQLTQAKTAATREASGSLTLEFSKSPSQLTMGQIVKGESFNALPKDEQARMHEFMRHQVQSGQDRARGLADRAESKNRQKWDENPEALTRYSEIADSDELLKMTTAQVYSLVSEVGPRMASSLESIRKTRVSTGQKASYDPVLIKEATPPELLKAQTPAAKQKLAVFNSINARQLYEWKDRNPGKAPTIEQQTELLRAGSREYTAPDSFLWFDQKKKAYELKPMPQEFRDAAKAYAKSANLPVPTEAQIMGQWAKQKDAL